MLVGNESVSTEQQYFTAAGYVVRADGTIRGFAFDSDVEHGTEIPTVAAGRSFQIAGSAVSGIVATDRLVIEVWSQGAPSSAVACNMRFRYDGNTIPADLVANNNAASYVESAQAGLFGTAPPPPLDSTTLYFRATADNKDIHTTAEFSSMTPLDRLTQCHDLQLQPNPVSGASASQTLLGSANTVAFNTYLGKFLSPTLGVATIPAGTWEIGSVLVEDAGGANRFLALSVYVVKVDDTVRGYVYDSPTALGPEAQITPIASVDTFTGAAVTGIINTDRLVVEVWTSTPGQDAANVRRQTFTYDGTTTIVDGVTNASPKSYIVAPVGGLVSTVTPYSPTATTTPSGALSITAVAPLSLGAGGATTPAGTLTLTTSPTLSTGQLGGVIQPNGLLDIQKTSQSAPVQGQGGSGARQPYLRLCGIEIMNAARTVEYIWRAGSSRFEVLADVHPVLYHTQGFEESFVSPSTDPAPWFDPSLPASGEFLGFLGEITEVSTPTARQVSALARGGAQLGGYRLGPRTLTVKGYLIATTWAGQQYGREWLANALSSCLGCGLCDSQVYLYAPTLDRLDSTDGRYTLYESALTDGPKETAKPNCPEVCSLEFTITSEHGEWFEPVLLAAPVQEIPDPSFPPGCVPFDTWLCEQPLGSVSALVNPPRVGQLGVIVSIDATDGEANGIEIALYADCTGTGDPVRRIIVGNVPLGGYLTVDSARRRVTFITPDGDVLDGIGFLVPDEETDIEWVEMNFCDRQACIVVRKQANCSTTSGVGVAIQTQLRTR
jgi:hypothetical protein